MHIVFQQQNINILSKSFELDESLRNEIMLITDDYSVGPLKDIYSPEGIEERKQWWQKVSAGVDYSNVTENGETDDNKTVNQIKEKLQNNAEENLWIWVAPNNRDVSGYYWLMAQLQEFVGRVYILSLNNLPFINEKGAIFYPVNLFEIPPREFLKAKKLARPVTLSEFEIDPEEWTKICGENKIIRILEGAKKLSQHDEDFYDQFLLELITPDWQKVNKVIHQFLNKSKHTIGHAYTLWRLKELLAGGKIDAQGEIKNIKDFEVKKKAAAAEEEEI